MSSERRTRTSRANGALSRGPVTPEGKARSALNALGHGLSAKRVVLSSESKDGFNRLRDAFVVEFAPESALDADLIEQLASARWLIQRSWALQTGLLDLEMLKQEKQVEQDFEVIEDHIRTALAFRAVTDESRSLAAAPASAPSSFSAAAPDQPDPPAEPDPDSSEPASTGPALTPLLIASPSGPEPATADAAQTLLVAAASEAGSTPAAYPWTRG